ncbi:MAG: hypothetical protein ACLRVN_06790 [Butyricicoccus sp.]
MLGNTHHQRRAVLQLEAKFIKYVEELTLVPAFTLLTKTAPFTTMSGGFSAQDMTG